MSTDLPTPSPTPRPAVPPDGESELPTRDVTELGDDEDLPTEPGPGEPEAPPDGESAPWPSSAPAQGAAAPMTFRDEDGRVHLSADMQPSDHRRAGDDLAPPANAAPGLLRA